MMDEANLEMNGDIYHYTPSAPAKKRWKLHYVAVKESNLLIYNKTDDVPFTYTSLVQSVSFHNISSIYEASIINESNSIAPKGANCGFIIDYDKENLKFLANSPEQRSHWVKILNHIHQYWNGSTNELTRWESSTKDVGRSDTDDEPILTTSTSETDPLSNLYQVKVITPSASKEDFTGSDELIIAQVRLISSNDKITDFSLSLSDTTEDVLCQIRDLMTSSSSSLFLLDTLGNIQHLGSQDKPGYYLSHIYGLCVVEPKNRIFVIHFPNYEWVPIILPKTATAQQILETHKVSQITSKSSITNPTLFAHKITSTGINISSVSSSGHQFFPDDTPADFAYTIGREGLIIVQPFRLQVQSTLNVGSMRNDRSRLRAITIKERNNFIAANTISRPNNEPQDLDLIYSNAIENLENDPLQSAVSASLLIANSEKLCKKTNRSSLEEAISESNLINISPSTETRKNSDTKNPISSNIRSNSRSSMKLKTVFKRDSSRIKRALDGSISSVTMGMDIHDQAEIIESLWKESPNISSIDEGHFESESSTNDAKIDGPGATTPNSTVLSNSLFYNPNRNSNLRSPIYSSSRNDLDNKKAPTARDLARQLTLTKKQDMSPLVETADRHFGMLGLTEPEVSQYPNLDSVAWNSTDQPSTPSKISSDSSKYNNIIEDLLNKAQMENVKFPTFSSENTAIPIPSNLPQKSDQILKISSPAMLRTWVLNKSQNPPAKIQINNSILKWVANKDNGYWKLAEGSLYSNMVLTNDFEQSKAVFKLPGEIELTYWERIKAWSVTGPSVGSELVKEAPKKETKLSKLTNLLLPTQTHRVEKLKRYAVAIYPSTDPSEDELHFEIGQVMTVLKEVDDDWLQCEIQGRRGLVPLNYVKIDSNVYGDDAMKTSTHSITSTDTNEITDVACTDDANTDDVNSDDVSSLNTDPSLLIPEKTVTASTTISGTATITNDDLMVSDTPVVANTSNEIERDFVSATIVTKLKQEVINLHNAIDPILWHASATRDPEMRQLLLDDRKTPAVAKLIRGTFTTVLAGILLQGMKQKSNLLQIDYNSIWTLVTASAKYCQTTELANMLRASCEDVVIMSQVTSKLASPSAKFRSFICQVLNNHFLEFWLRELFFTLSLSYLDYLYEPFSSYVCLSEHHKLRPLINDMILAVQPLDTLPFNLNIKIDEEMHVSSRTLGVGLSKLGGWMFKAINAPINPNTLIKDKTQPTVQTKFIQKAPPSISANAPASPTNAKSSTLFSAKANAGVNNSLVSAHTEAIASQAVETRSAQTKKNSIDQLNKIVGKDTSLPNSIDSTKEH